MSLPPSRKTRMSRSHEHSPKQEARIAKSVRGRPVAGSGAGWEKGDVRKEGFVRIEAKTTLKKSFAVSRKLIEKIEDEATGCAEMPAIALDFLNPDGTVDKAVYIVPAYALEEIIRRGSTQDTT